MSPALEIACYVLGVLLVLLGAIGAVYPLLPGGPLVFAGLWLVAWLGDYEKVSVGVIALLGVLMLGSLVLDTVLGMLGAKRAGASKLGILGSTLGAIVGIPFGFLGVVLGPLLGALVFEYWAQRDLGRAGHVAFATWLGTLLGTVAKVVVIWVMIGIFGVAWVL
jgi:uncharacterized protein